jgi:general secretion pathway protein M
MRATPADTLAQWLSQARSNARAVPREAHLTRPAQGAPAPSSPSPPAAARAAEPSAVRWDGTLVMSLPAR